MARFGTKALLLIGSAAVVAPAGAVWAQTAPDAGAVSSAPSQGIDDIVVTAQRRAESVQDTPLAITAASGENLRQQNVTRLEDLNNSVPNVNINSANGNGRITIRGISNAAVQPGSEANVAYHVDGVYVSRPTSTLNSFYDVERLEVVRGPQGTLYGRNATGGAINVITRDPTDTLSGFGEVTIGNYETINTEAGIGGPLAEGISARIAFQTQNRGGFGTQSFPSGAPILPAGTAGSGVPQTRSSGFKEDLDDLRTRAVRAKLKFETGDFTALVAAEYYYQKDHSGIYKSARTGDSGLPLVDTLVGGIQAPNKYRDVYTSFPQGTRKEDYAFTGTLSWSPSAEFNLTSITGYRNTDFDQHWNQGGTQLATFLYTSGESGHQISQELRASGTIGRLSYVVGGFLYREVQNVYSIDPIHNIAFGFPAATSFLSQGYGTSLKLKTDVAAAFGQLSYEITDQFGIDVGARYNWERKKKPFENFGYALCTPYAPGQVPWQTTGACDISVIIGPRQVSSKSFKPKVTARFKPNDDLLVYASYGEAFRSGGYNFGGGVDADPFKPEELVAYEVGLKADLLDRRLQANFAAFHYKYSNLQVTRLTDAGTGVITESAGEAKISGLEVSLIALPVDNLRLNVDLGLLRARYKKFSSTNSSLVNCASGPLFCNRALYPTGIDPVRNALVGVVQDLKGNDLIQAPSYTINAGAEYTFNASMGDLTLRGQGTLTDDIYFTAFNTAPFTQKSYVLFDAFLRYEHPDRRLYGSLFAKNIGNKKYWSNFSAQGQVLGGTVNGISGPPRTFGLTVGFKL